MRLKDKLSRVPGPLASSSAPTSDPARQERIARLRERMLGVGRGTSTARRRPPPALSADDPRLPGECRQTEHGPLRVVVRQLESDHCHGDAPVAAALDVPAGVVSALALDGGLGDVSSNELLFIDTETTGLAGGTGTVPFLIGMAWFEGTRLRVEQLLLCGLGQETPMLTRLTERLQAASAVVTYNGKTFDWPLLRSRYILNRVAAPGPFNHFDLLHACRRVYKRRLDGMRLCHVEREVLGYERIDDIDGALIPERYFSFLRGGDPSLIEPVLTHNVDDLIALAALLGRLAQQWQAQDDREDARDRLSIAEVALRHGDLSRALEFADAAVQAAGDDSTAVDALVLAARLARRAGDDAGAERRYRDALGLIGHEVEAAPIHLALSKLYEHRLRQPQRALEHAVLATAGEGAEVHGRRIARLERKLARGAGRR